MVIRINNLHILGTSHISKQSLNDINASFHKIEPDIVAVELDKNRLESLFSNQKPNYSPKIIKEIGFKGYLFLLIGGLLQQKLGSIVGVKPGSDMLRAVELARDNSKRLALIDQDVKITLSRLSKEIKFKEKLRFVFDIFFAPFSKKMRIDLSKVPEKEVIIKLLNIIKKRYPSFYNILIAERNIFMAQRLIYIHKNHPDAKILVVVGAGHEEGLEKELNRLISLS